MLDDIHRPSQSYVDRGFSEFARTTTDFRLQR